MLVQDIERREDGPAIREGVAPDRMPSVHDPEQRHGRKSKSKRFDGHKVQVAVDTDSQLITAVEVLPGNAADAEQALAVVEQTEAATGCAVDETIGDCAYGDGATRQAFADAERKLVAKVPSASNQGRFPKTAFQLDVEAGTATCPAGQTTEDLKPRQGGGGQFQFAAVRLRRTRVVRCARSACGAAVDEPCSSTPRSGCCRRRASCKPAPSFRSIGPSGK